MSTFSGEFLGCKVSHQDLEALRERLAGDGLAEVAAGGDVHLVNGCCVTAEAVAKTRQAVRRALRSSGRVVVTGCVAGLPASALAGLDDDGRVHVVPRASEDVPGAVADLLAGLGCRGGAPGPPRRDRVRAFLRVQDGCSFSCAFCVIPLVRGATRSRPLDAIVAEARRRVAQGFAEFVLSGVNIGLYRGVADGARSGLPDVVRAVGAVDGVTRLRLSSIEPDHLDDAVLAALADVGALPHLHVPLQSGSDDVLAAMRRRYRRDRYLRRVARAREVLGDDLNVTADVLVGFPGESEDDFAATLDAVRQAGLSRVHAFPYSPRPGTRTADVDPVPAEVKRERSARLRALADAAGAARRAARVGRDDEVLVERVAAGVAEGYGRDYTRVLVPGAAAAAPGDVLHVRLSGVDGDAMAGRVSALAPARG